MAHVPPLSYSLTKVHLNRMKSIVHSRFCLITVGAIIVSSAAISHPPLFAQAPPAPPVNSGDALAFDAASALMDQKKFKEAVVAFEKFLEKYKMLSPKSLDATFRLAVCYIQTQDYDSPIKHLRNITTNPKVELPGKEAAQMLIAKSVTLKGVNLPSESDAQKKEQNRIFELAIGEYETFLKSYPQTREMDNAHFLRATLLMQVGKYDEAVKGYQAVEKIGQQNTPLYWDAVLSSGRALFAMASGLMEQKDGKEVAPENLKKALDIFVQAQPILGRVYAGSNDVAMANEATYYAAQMQLTRSQNPTEVDEEKRKKEVQDLLMGAYEAFRAVRAREEVITEQQKKIDYYKRQIPLVQPGITYQSQIARINNLIDIEEQKLDRYKTGPDQYLAAKLALARIYLFQKKPDESRVLIRYLQAQEELLKSDKDALPTITALVALTYGEQGNLEKALAGYEEFRTKFKSNPNGDNLPLLVAKLLIDSEKTPNVEKAITVVNDGMTDYKQWRFLGRANSLLAAALTKLRKFDKAIEALDQAIPASPEEEDAAQLYFVRGNILEAMARENKDAAKADEAIAAYKLVIDKYGKYSYSEDAQFGIAQIMSGKDPKAAAPLLQAFVEAYSAGTPKSENTAKNVPIAQYLLGKCLAGSNQKDEAVTAWAKLAEKWPDSEPAPGSYFQRFDIFSERKNYAKCMELMDGFIKSYPTHENVYFAFNNQAEMLFTKPGPEGKSPNMLQNTREGAAKLMEFVNFELEKNPAAKRGDQSLVKIAAKWSAQIPQKNFLIMNSDEKLVWQEAVDNATKAVEMILEKYADQPSEMNKVGEGLEKLVTVQKARTAADPSNAAKVGDYFKELATKYNGKPSVRSNVLFALGAVLWDKNRSEAMRAMADGYKADVKFTTDDMDRYMEGLLTDKKFDKVNELAAKLAADYPKEAQDPQATSLFWQGKVLAEQGKIKDAAAKYEELQKSFGGSKKVLEADYGVIRSKVDEGKLEDDFIPRLEKVVKMQSKTFDLQARALLLIARIQELQGDIDSAIDNYIKIHTRYESVPDVCAEGLWRGSNLLEQQANGKLKVMTPEERKKFLAGKKKPETKPADAKPADPKPTDAKPADPKKETAEAPAPAEKATAAKK